MPYDYEERNYCICIQDYDGVSFRGATRFVGYDGTTRGLKILLGQRYSFNWELEIDDTTKTNVPFNTDYTYSKSHSHLKRTGLKRRVFTVDCAVETEGRGVEFVGAGYKRLDMLVVQDLLFFNHRYYITDYMGSQTSTEMPIYQLMNETSSLYYSMFSSQSVNFKGLPVMVRGITNVVTHPAFITFTMTLVEDTAEA